jgi:hypothetical protein
MTRIKNIYELNKEIDRLKISVNFLLIVNFIFIIVLIVLVNEILLKSN